MNILTRRPTDDDLARIAERVCDLTVTYDHVGSTIDIGADVARARRVRRFERPAGTGPAALEAGRGAIRRWAAHDALGATVHPRHAPIVQGTVVVVALRVGPIHVVAPTRIVRVVDDATRFGFAYGTLTGHPEAGEESFVVEQRGDGSVVAVVAVDARPGSPLAWAGLPVTLALQRHAIRRYLDGLTTPAPPAPASPSH